MPDDAAGGSAGGEADGRDGDAEVILDGGDSSPPDSNGPDADAARESGPLTGVITEFEVPTAKCYPNGITAGPDGNVWFTEADGSKIGRITPSGNIKEFSLAPASFPMHITWGPDSNLWFTEYARGKIGKITPGGVIREFDVKASVGALYVDFIVAGADGNLWFTNSSPDSAPNCLGRITTEGDATLLPLDRAPSDCYALARGFGDDLWFSENFTNQIAHLTLSGAVTEFGVSTIQEYGATSIVAGPDGNIWFTEMTQGKIGRMAPTGTLAEFKLPVLTALPFDITVGPDGNLWFTENAASHSRIGRITPAGVITEFEPPTDGSRPVRITAGPDGNLWFTESAGNRIGRIMP